METQKQVHSTKEVGVVEAGPSRQAKNESRGEGTAKREKVKG
jgi:hypothetical protein